LPEGEFKEEVEGGSKILEGDKVVPGLVPAWGEFRETASRRKKKKNGREA